MSRFELLEDGRGALTHRRGHVQLGPDRRAREEAGNHGIASLGVQRPFAGKIGGDDAQPLAQLENLPAFPAENAHARARLRQGIAFTGHGFDQRGLAAAVGAQQSDVLSGGDAQGDIMKHNLKASRYRDIFQFQKRFASHENDFILGIERAPSRARISH